MNPAQPPGGWRPGPQPGAPQQGGPGGPAGIGPNGPAGFAPGGPHPHGPGPYGAGPPGPGGPHAPKKSRKGLWIALGCVAGALVLIGGVLLIVDKVQSDRAAERRENQLTEQTEAAKQVVTDYLTAIADGDAEAALAVVKDAPEGPLLTDEALEASNSEGGLTDPQVTDASMQQLEDDSVPRGQITASYTVGDLDVPSRTFDVENSAEGWRIKDATSTAAIGGTGAKINGQKLPADTTEVAVFPGTYAFTASNDRLQINADPQVVTGLPEESLTWSFSPTLSEKGTKDILSAGRASLDACLNKKELAPAGCPMINWQESNGIKVDQSTIRYTLENDPWANVDLALNGEGTAATAMITTTIKINANATQNGASGTLDADPANRTTPMTADITGPQVKVAWGVGG